MRLLFFLIILLQFCVAEAALVFRGVGITNTTANATSYACAVTNTPSAGALVLVAVMNSKASAPDRPTLSGHGMFWREVLTTNFNTIASPTVRMTLFCALTNGAPAASPAITADFAGATQTGCNINAVQVSGTETNYLDGTNAIVQVVFNRADSGANPSLQFTNAVRSRGSNMVVAFFGNTDNNGSWGEPESAYAEFFDNGYATPSTGIYTMWSTNVPFTDSSPSVTAASGAWMGVAVEVRDPLTVGEINGITVETNGWVAQLYVSGLNTNGTFVSGLGTNNTLNGIENLRITLSRMGFTTNATPTIRQKTVYGKKVLRRPYPYQGTVASPTNDIVPDGNGCMLRVALSEFIYDLDSNITAVIGTGAYTTTNAATNSIAISGIPVSNLSTQYYMKPTGNWTWPGLQRETNGFSVLRAVGFHGDVKDFGQPLACAVFILSDTNTTPKRTTNFVTQMSIDYAMTNVPFRFGEYICNASLAGLSNGPIRADIMFVPWFGNSNAILTTTTDSYRYPQPAPLTNWNDPGIHFCYFIAVVDPAGVDGNGRVTNTTPENVNSAHYFGTINKAAAQMKLTNNALGHNDHGGGVIYLRTGVTNWTGSNQVNGGDSKVWSTVRAYPGHDVTLTWTAAAGAWEKDVGANMKFENIRIATDPTIVSFFRYGFKVWLDNCTITTSSDRVFYNCTNIYLTRTKIPQLGQGFIGPSGVSDCNFALVRSCDLTSYDGSSVFWTMVGNSATGTNSLQCYWSITNAGQVVAPKFNLMYNNYLGGFDRNGTHFISSDESIYDGIAIVQNVFEAVTTNAAFSSAYFFMTDNGFNYTNVIFWNNINVGARMGMGYNDVGSTPRWRILWSVQGNISDLRGYKDDTQPTEDGARAYGNWPIGYEVNWSKEMHTECAVHDTAGGFLPDSIGISTYYPLSSTGTGGTNLPDFMRFVYRGAYNGYYTNVTGGGNYRLRSDSPAWRLHSYNWYLPFDIEGNARGLSDPPGAFSSGNVRKGAFF